MNTPALDALLAQATQGKLTYDLALADNGNKETDMYGESEHLMEPVCIIPHDDITDEGYEEVKANVLKLAIFGTHATELVQVLKAQLELLKGCQFGFNTFLPDSKFIAREALSRIDPAIAHLEKLLTALEQEAACQK